MKQDADSYPFKFIFGFVAVVVIALLFSGCGTTWRVEYNDPKYGNAAVQFELSKKGGHAK